MTRTRAKGERTRILMQYLPSIGGFGSYSYASTTTFNPNAFTWQVGLGLTWTILDGGLREASIREATAKPGVTLAVVPLRVLAERDGVLDQLAGQGLSITGPAW